MNTANKKRISVSTLRVVEVQILQQDQTWMSVKDVSMHMRLSSEKVRRMLVNIIKHPQPVRGKLRSYGFYFDSNKISIRIVKADVDRMLPTPKNFVVNWWKRSRGLGKSQFAPHFE